MAKIEWVELRLRNWARWKASGGSGGLGYASGSLNDRVDGDRYRESVIPTDEVDASVTDQAVQSLQLTRSHLHLTLVCVYIKDMPRADAARRMQCSLDAVYARRDEAHRALAQWFDERGRRQAAARQLADAQARVRLMGVPLVRVNT